MFVDSLCVSNPWKGFKPFQGLIRNGERNWWQIVRQHPLVWFRWQLYDRAYKKSRSKIEICNCANEQMSKRRGKTSLPIFHSSILPSVQSQPARAGGRRENVKRFLKHALHWLPPLRYSPNCGWRTSTPLLLFLPDAIVNSSWYINLLIE
jgi:hypothetical protein